jgi:hypothetical protein
MNPHEKTDWVTEPIRYPRNWQQGADQLARALFEPRANVIRRALRVGLIMVAHQEDVCRESLSAALSIPDIAPALGRPKLAAHERKTESAPCPTCPADRPAGSGESRGEKDAAREKSAPRQTSAGPGNASGGPGTGNKTRRAIR